jgi:hypothetical protein
VQFCFISRRSHSPPGLNRSDGPGKDGWRKNRRTLSLRRDEAPGSNVSYQDAVQLTNVILALTLTSLLDLTVADRPPMTVKAERVTRQRSVADNALSDCQSLLCDRLSDSGFQSQTFRIDPEISKDRRSSAMNRRGQIESFCHRFLSAFSSQPILTRAQIRIKSGNLDLKESSEKKHRLEVENLTKRISRH